MWGKYTHCSDKSTWKKNYVKRYYSSMYVLLNRAEPYTQGCSIAIHQRSQWDGSIGRVEICFTGKYLRSTMSGHKDLNEHNWKDSGMCEEGKVMHCNSEKNYCIGIKQQFGLG